MNLENIKGIGSKSLDVLNNLGIYNIDDLVRNYPYRFDILARRNIMDEGTHDNFVSDGIVETNAVVNFFKGKNRLSFSCNVQNIIIKVVIFNRAFLKNNIKIGGNVTLIGKYNEKTKTLTASNILFSKLDNKEKIIPVYHLSKSITSKQMSNFINNALEIYNVKESLPVNLIDKYNFMSLNEAINIIHRPDSKENLKDALKVLKYEEIYTYLKKIKELKEHNLIKDKKYIKNININKVNEFIKSLPFELTKDQIDAVFNMLDDVQKDIKMNRLLQGDVGSGKTIVAFILAYALYTGGFQSCLMAPTEILAIQHYENAIKLFSDFGLNVGLLTGKMTLKQKKEMYEKIKNHEIDLLIGTHALINDDVIFDKLGLIITDEQHRFGVNQRLALKNKSDIVDVLMMSATPIPRTYALTLYGDTDITSIKTMPKGRKPIITKCKKKEELKDVLVGIYEALKNNNQAYVIAPMIEENEDTDYSNVYDLKHKFELAFKNYTVEILHGKMSKEEKDKIMQDYLDNKINILISTTVIEVGIDVKNATVMVIFDADKFGLSTLHQLRGRVGRNDLQSYCYLVSDKDSKRLKIMEDTNDGYLISEEDFKLRGEGDIFGLRQSGMLSFKLSDIRKDFGLILKVKEDMEGRNL